ncbi:hypothetical protein AAES_54184 [Amazona aestiva]|uniref:Uncharacterized protein n=1 Tax=Amazona aestiva TaxID=12930 RepID=A0A0Q3MN40_AMAAE|nr:hypothetical protein AAES_54184 [Amazona aestiva]
MAYESLHVSLYDLHTYLNINYCSLDEDVWLYPQNKAMRSEKALKTLDLQFKEGFSGPVDLLLVDYCFDRLGACTAVMPHPINFKLPEEPSWLQYLINAKVFNSISLCLCGLGECYYTHFPDEDMVSQVSDAVLK